ncbi:hypothetical protein AB0B12_33315 [Streptomyces sp. NPDC044780]|uniref:hypothetical protein n=1 Tax=unclassified Streptomyces TaxID=2593676 RepID=UPI0033CF010C
MVDRADRHPAAEALVRGCRAVDCAPQIAYETHDDQEAWAMVAAGLDVGQGPGPGPGRHSARRQRAAAAAARRIQPVRMADHALTPAAGAFIGSLRESAADRRNDPERGA